MNPEPDNVISVDQLQVGVYVYLDVGWMRHPFTFNNFKIRDEDQLDIIRRLGLDHVRWDPLRSDLKPLPKPSPAEDGASPAQIEPAAPAEDEDHQMLAAKRVRIQRLSEHRHRMSHVEAAFQSAANVVRGINKNIHSQPARTVNDASQLIEQVVDSLLAAPELTIQLMSEKPGNEDYYFHSLNVAVLSMTLGRELGLPAEIVRSIGLGALFHDIGLNEIPAKILNNPGPLSKAEREFREMHCQYGLDIAKKSSLPGSVQKIILQHHELFDGTGYPAALKSEAIDTLARLVGLINAYDNLCNPVGSASGMTPHEALSYMFAQQRKRFDPRFLQAFIRFMGVYPPGSVVGLSNDALGLVIRVNSSRPLRPSIIVYDAGIPKSEAIILDLEEEPDINITRAIKPAQLPAAVYDYLSPRRRVSYYFDSSSATA
jgi:putative nucleotidyltransferase with HDIG domain